MGIADDGLDTDPPDGGQPDPKVKLCQNCQEKPAGFGKFGRYCEECRDAGAGKKEAKPEEPPPFQKKKSAPSPRSNAGKLHAKLKDAHYGASLGLVLVTNPGVLSNPGLIDILEGKSNDWAAATVALAESDARIADLLERALRAGVWVSFITQTVGSLVVVGTLTGRAKVPYGAISFLAPELVPYMRTEASSGAQAA